MDGSKMSKDNTEAGFKRLIRVLETLEKDLLRQPKRLTAHQRVQEALALTKLLYDKQGAKK